MLLRVTTWVLSSFPKGLNKEETVCEEVWYIYSTCLPRQDIGERKILWSTRNNTSHERQTEETRLPGNQLLRWTRNILSYFENWDINILLGYSPNTNACSRSKEVWILIKESSQPYYSFNIKKYWKTTTTTKNTKPTRQASFTTCTCILSERHRYAILFQETCF